MGPRFESGLLHQVYGAVAQWVEQCFFTDCRRKLPELGGESLSENTYNVIAPESGVLKTIMDQMGLNACLHKMKPLNPNS